MIKIDIESANVETRTKKNGGGQYHVQEGFAHTFNNSGEPNRYPERFTVFVPKDNNGNPIPYQPGTYTLAQHCIRIENGFLGLGFPQLIPIGQKKAS